MTLPPAEILIRKLQSNNVVGDEDRCAIRAMDLSPKLVEADRDIVSRGDRPKHCAVIIQGWAYRYKILNSGKRQIVSFHYPGDMPDLQSLLIPRSDHYIAALSGTMVAMMPHGQMRELMKRSPGLGEIFWRDTLIDSAIYREWVVNVGQRPAVERVAHLFCETFVRLEAIGLAQRVGDTGRFPWPVTQALLSEAAGMSAVHVNRTLQDLRASRLIKTLQGAITIPSWNRLEEVAGFEPDYLSIEEIQTELGEPDWPSRTRFSNGAAVGRSN